MLQLTLCGGTVARVAVCQAQRPNEGTIRFFLCVHLKFAWKPQYFARPRRLEAWLTGVLSGWPLVGRREELALCERCLRGGAARGVVIAGAVGVGKTRLAREV